MSFVINVVGVFVGYLWFGPWFTVPILFVSFRWNTDFFGFRLGK